jgi:hypothetical protein
MNSTFVGGRRLLRGPAKGSAAARPGTTRSSDWDTVDRQFPRSRTSKSICIFRCTKYRDNAQKRILPPRNFHERSRAGKSPALLCVFFGLVPGLPALPDRSPYENRRLLPGAWRCPAGFAILNLRPLLATPSPTPQIWRGHCHGGCTPGDLSLPRPAQPGVASRVIRPLHLVPYCTKPYNFERPRYARIRTACASSRSSV